MRPADAVILAEMRESCTSGAARGCRIAARLTQREMGSACGVTAQTIALWETGQRTPTGPPALEYGRLLRQLAKRAA
jgi:DNA-binding XRE family transcriptional regulator